MNDVMKKTRAAAAAASHLASAPTGQKNEMLLALADRLENEVAAILEANRRDVRALGDDPRHTDAFRDRLTLSEERIEAMARGLRTVALLPDPVGSANQTRRLPNGLNLARVRVPLGVIGIIYEARPNVTVDAAGLCLKSGNVTVLRGGSEATHSNAELVRHIRYALESRGLPADACQLIEDTSRAAAKELMSAREYLDVLIPRGGASLIRAVVDNARVPVIETGVGNCHTFVDAGADLEMAVRIAHNAKVQRPGVCNSMETLLIHADIADEFLPAVAHRLEDSGVQLRGCPRTREYLPHVTPAAEADWETEYLDLILAVRVVEDFDEAVEHIRRYGTRHSEAIVTSDYSHARRFTDEVDAAAVYVNASTRFTDGSEFGLGAEIGISTQKMHARGPMGLEELTSCKYVITGDGQIR